MLDETGARGAGRRASWRASFELEVRLGMGVREVYSGTSNLLFLLCGTSAPIKIAVRARALQLRVGSSWGLKLDPERSNTEQSTARWPKDCLMSAESCLPARRACRGFPFHDAGEALGAALAAMLALGKRLQY